MATYVMSDIHGDFEGYLKILDKTQFANTDVLYMNEDVI